MSASSLNTYLMLSSLLPPSLDTMHTHTEQTLQLKKLFSTYRWCQSKQFSPFLTLYWDQIVPSFKKATEGRSAHLKSKENTKKFQSTFPSDYSHVKLLRIRARRISQHARVWFRSGALQKLPLMTLLHLQQHCHLALRFLLSTLAHSKGGRRELNFV